MRVYRNSAGQHINYVNFAGSAADALPSASTGHPMALIELIRDKVLIEDSEQIQHATNWDPREDAQDEEKR